MGYALTLKATLEGVTDLQPVDTPETPFEYTFKVECTSCREVHAKEVNINTLEKHEIDGSRGSASFVFRCTFCRREASASEYFPRHRAANRRLTTPAISRTKNVCTIDDDKPVKILEIDSRGLELKEFIPVGNFMCKAAEGATKFSEVDLSEGEWYDYDDNAGAEVSITEVQWDIVRS